MASSGKGTFQPESDVHIAREDQDKINKFARLNAKVDDLLEELKVKHNDLKNIQEAEEELALSDETDKLPYMIGEVFLCMSVADTLQSLDQTKTEKMQEIQELEKKCEEIKDAMDKLRGNLYSRFGSHINLEKDDD